MAWSKSRSKRKVYSNTIFKKQETSQINNLTLYLKKQNKTKKKTRERTKSKLVEGKKA